MTKGFDGHHFIAGLASHFRDLLVCKNEVTIQLLEVSDETKQRYTDQSKLAPTDFLIKGIAKASECDLNYKNSRNQRLLVELCLMQLASITLSLWEEKKNSESYIIPAAHFRNYKTSEVHNTVPHTAETTVQATIAVENTTPSENSDTSAISAVQTTAPIESQDLATEVLQKPQESTEIKDYTTKVASVPALDIEDRTTTQINIIPQSPEREKRSSGLSLKSIRKKKEHLVEKGKIAPDPQNLPKEPFTEAELLSAWKAYGKRQDKKGERILGSMLAMNLPTFKDGKICLELPNFSMKEDLESAKPALFQYLYQRLKNYELDLHIEVNETAAKKYAFTPQDKYEKLREINPLIDKLRSTFDLDL